MTAVKLSLTVASTLFLLLLNNILTKASAAQNLWDITSGRGEMVVPLFDRKLR